MKIKERVIDLRQYILYLWENVIIIIILVGLFTCGMTVFSYIKQKNEIVSLTESETSTLESIMTQNHDAYYHLNDVKSYTDAVPPANTYNSHAKLYVDFNFSDIEGGENLDVNSMINKFQQDALILIVSQDSLGSVIDKLDLNSYEDMSNLTSDDLGWMVNRNFLGANVMQIVVTDVDPDRAKLICDAVIEEFISRTNELTSIDSVSVIDPPSQPEAGIKKESANSSVQLAISKKKLLKYAILGCALGVVFIAVIYLLMFLFKDAVRNSLDLAFADISLFGSVSKKEKKKKENYKRLAYNISLLDACKVLTIVPVDGKSDGISLVEGISVELKSIGKKVATISGEDADIGQIQENIESIKEKSDIVLITVKNIKEYADATLVATYSDMVMLEVTFGKTRVKDVLYAETELNKTGANMLGAVMDQARYI